jgi:hypothetical protein
MRVLRGFGQDIQTIDFSDEPMEITVRPPLIIAGNVIAFGLSGVLFALGFRRLALIPLVTTAVDVAGRQFSPEYANLMRPINRENPV